jgi:glyoxylase-like metal-dependent hydrolase (beta-lactamase superfamily II)/rhodanese-related sulfurtransferase
MNSVQQIDVATLRAWLESGKKVNIVDIRPGDERNEWFIPGSTHIDAYEKLKQNDSNALRNVDFDKNVPVVTVCAGGKTSVIAANRLQEQGYEVYSLKDGMKGWSLAWNQALLQFEDYQIIQVRRTGKGCLSYIIGSNNNAIIVDTSLPVDIYEGILHQQGWQLQSVMETHIHADHLSRSKQIADRFGVPLFLPIPNRVEFGYETLEEGDTIKLDEISIAVLATPGHTVESVCFLINGEVLLSGDTIFTNAVGRPDLKSTEEEAKKRAVLLYDSLQKLMELNEAVIVLPAHTNAPVDFDHRPITSTLAKIRNDVAVINLPRVEFVKQILSNLPDPPLNYLAIVERNISGDISDVNPIEIEAGANRCAIS